MVCTNIIPFDHQNGKAIVKNPLSSLKFNQPCREVEDESHNYYFPNYVLAWFATDNIP